MLPKDYFKKRRERIERGKWAAAGLEYCKGKSLAKELLKQQTQELEGQMRANSSGVMEHATTEIRTEMSGIKAALPEILTKVSAIEAALQPLTPRESETTKEAKARNKLEAQALRCLDAHEREQARQKKAEAKAQAKKRRTD